MKTILPGLHQRGLIAVISGCVAMALASCEPPKGTGDAGHYPDAGLKGPNNFNMGAVLAWRKGTLPVEGKPCSAAVGHILIVRVRNLDGWLNRKILVGSITDEPEITSEQCKNFIFIQEHLGQDGDLNKFIKAYEALDRPGSPADSASPATPLEPLPKGVTGAKLRAAKNGYDALLATVQRKLFLVLNNSQFRNIKADNADAGVVTGVAKAADGTTLNEFEFRLERRPGDEDAWGALYDGTRCVEDVRVSVGLELDKRVFVLDTAIFPQADAPVQRFQIALFNQLWLWTVLAVMAAFLAGIFVLSAHTALLRDNDLPLRADGRAQFSLARIQLAFWTYLVVGAFLIIWLVTDRLDTLNPTILALLGISSGTTIASKLANSLTLTGGAMPHEPRRAARRGQSIRDLRTQLAEEIRTLSGEADTLEQQRLAAPTAALDAQATSLAVRIQRLHDDFDYLGYNPLMRFCADMLSENGRVSLHRLQVVVWTVVLGVVFINKVKRELAMPVFGDTLLGLMGLSSLTYVALKVPELKRTEADVTASAPNARG